MNARQKRQERIQTLQGMLEAFEKAKTEGVPDWDATAAIEGVDLSKCEDEAAKVAVVTSLYDEHDAAITAENEAVKADKDAAEAAKALRERRLSNLEPVSAPAVHTLRKTLPEFDAMKAVQAVERLGNRVGIPHEYFVRSKVAFRTFGGALIERTKAALEFPSRWAVQENVTQLAFQPSLFDYLRTFTTEAGAWPIRKATDASDANVGQQGTPGTALNEASLQAVIQENTLIPVGSFSPITRQERRVPGAVSWAMDSLGDAVRAEMDRRMVTGAGNINGIAERTYPAARKIAVAANASLLDGLADAVAASFGARGRAPDFLVAHPTAIARAVKEAKSGSGYSAKKSPEMVADMLWDTVVIRSNHAPADKLFTGYSGDMATILHSDGFVMEDGLSGTDFVKLQDTIRAFCEMQLIFRREESLVEVTLS